MIARPVTITTAVALFAASVAFSQIRYSRPRSSSSPTPTPTPLPLIAPREASVRSQSAPQKTLPTPTPSRQTFGQSQTGMQRSTPIPTPARQTSMPMQRTGAAPVQPQANPTPAYGRFAPKPASAATSMQMTPAPHISQVKPAPNYGPIQPNAAAAGTPAPIPVKPTPTPVPPPDVKVYLDRQVAQSKDQKFHMNVNGKDLPLTPFHFWAQRSTGFNTSSTHVDMRSDEGRIYDIEFTTTGAQITNIRIHRINGETVR
jgi:hypothetical protein